MMTFDHIDDGQFEELIYDLLVELGFKNVNWRRGTGKGGATADQGRDIVGDAPRTDIDGASSLDHWFIQCKHYQAGVPPQKIEDALAWAMAERPAVLLIAASNFLSNPAKTYLESYKLNNRPPFQIRVWERKDLERLLSSKPGIVRKHELQPSDPYINTHPAHIYYLVTPTFNTLDYFFEQLEMMEPKIRDSIFSQLYYEIINPRMREPKHPDEIMADLMIDTVDYANFKKKCYQIKGLVSGGFLVRSIVTEALAWLWDRSNPQLLADKIARNQNSITFFKEKLSAADDPTDIKALRGCIETAESYISRAEPQQIDNLKIYTEFCETTLMKLALEKPDLSFLDKE